MILTVTPNSAIDRAIFVRGFRLGDKVQGEGQAFAPSGKGVGASLVIHELGGDTLASGFRAGRNGQLLGALLDEIGIRHDFVVAEGETRMSVVLVDLAARRQSTISVPSLRAGPGHLEDLLVVLDRYASQSWGVVFGGSLPPGLPRDAYAHLVRHARRLGLYTLLDSSGEPLREGVAGVPHLLKVNQDELRALDPEIAEALDDATEGAWTVAARLRARLGAWASEALIVTLGARGALALTARQTYIARPLRVPVVNTAGAGDALSGAIMMKRSQGASWPEALSLGMAAAASVVMNQGTGVCRRGQVGELLPQVVITG